MNINELPEGIDAMFEVYARARKFNNIKATLDELHKEGLPTDLYRKYLQEAKDSGFMADEFSAEEILRDLRPGESRFGFGP